MPDHIVLEAEGARAVFDLDDGFRMTSLVFGGRELTVTDPANGVFHWGGFVMAPWTSDIVDGAVEFLGTRFHMPVDLDGLAIHGVARKERWEWDGLGATCALGSGWPLGGSVRIEPTILGDRLEMTMELRAGELSMPGAIGWHPWLVRQLDGVLGEVVLPERALLQHRDAAGHPSGLWQALESRDRASPFNDGVQVEGPIDVVWPGVGRVRFASDAAYAIIFDASDLGICVEPMTSPAGAMDRLLAPRETLRLRFSVTWSPDVV